MRDEIDSRIWVEHGEAFADGLASFLATAAATVGTALRRLNEIEFDAPWKGDSRGPGHA